MRNHDGAVAGQERSIEYQMDALAGCDHRLHRRVGLAAQVVGERTGGVDYHLGGGFEFLARLDVAESYAVHEALGILGEIRDLGVVEQGGALLESGRDQVDQQAGIVKLAVEVNHAAS